MGIQILEPSGPARSKLISTVALTPGNWYRIAQFGNGEASGTSVRLAGEFTISDSQGGRHNYIKFHCAVAFGGVFGHTSLHPLQVTAYNSPCFGIVRCVSLNGTYGGHAIEVYCLTDMAAGMQLTVQNEDWQAGQNWELKNFINVPADVVAPQALLVARSLQATGHWVNFPSMLNGWVNYDAAGTQFAWGGYKLVPGSQVQLRGLIRSGTIANGASGTIFVMPVGFRPHRRAIFSCAANIESTLRVDVQATGEVVAIGGPGNNGWLSLDNIRYTAEQ